MLEVDGLRAGYAGNEVVHGVSFTVADGEAVAIIGSNGAGKTTLLRAVCASLKPFAGSVGFGDADVIGMPAYRIARLGMAYVPAERHLFWGMSVKENLELGAYPHRPDGDQLAMVFDLFPQLADRRAQHAGTMSGGEQQMLAVGRALMAKPRLLMLDEPTTGLAPRPAEEAYRALRILGREGLTILVAEQQVPLALALADRGYVLEDGRIQLEGSSEQLSGNPEVQRAYLGIA